MVKTVNITSFEEHYNKLMGSNNKLKKSATMSDEEKMFSFLIILLHFRGKINNIILIKF